MIPIKVVALLAACASTAFAVDIAVHAKGEKKISEIQYGLMHEVLSFLGIIIERPLLTS
jgi:hypothetical protein